MKVIIFKCSINLLVGQFSFINTISYKISHLTYMIKRCLEKTVPTYVYYGCKHISRQRAALNLNVVESTSYTKSYSPRKRWIAGVHFKPSIVEPNENKN